MLVEGSRWDGTNTDGHVSNEQWRLLGGVRDNAII